MVLSVIFSTSCDGFISAKGTVYEWMDAPASSRGEIYVDLDAPTNRIAIPVSDALVSFEPDFYRPVISDSEGNFDVSQVVAPMRYMMNIKIEKEGYLTLAAKFQHPSDDDFNHRITIFLVAEK